MTASPDKKENVARKIAETVRALDENKRDVVVSIASRRGEIYLTLVWSAVFYTRRMEGLSDNDPLARESAEALGRIQEKVVRFGFHTQGHLPFSDVVAAAIRTQKAQEEKQRLGKRKLRGEARAGKS
jgi:hypothetical protein